MAHARLPWRPATVVATRAETPTVRTLVLDVPGWPGHVAGQHVDVRLTAADGYQAQRSYSIASAPGAPRLELTVERLEEGEVSPWMTGIARTGDVFELRGPIGGWFVWLPRLTHPLALVAGGSGIVPLMAILRQRASATTPPPATLLHSVRTADERIYADELARLAAGDPALRVVHTLTRDAPDGWTGPRRRIDRDLLRDTVPPPHARPIVYVCGPTGLVETVADTLVDLGHPPVHIRTERFGPSGTRPVIPVTS